MTKETVLESIAALKAMTADGSITPTVLGNLLGQIMQYIEDTVTPVNAEVAQIIAEISDAVDDIKDDAEDAITTAKADALDDIDDAKEAAIAAIGSAVITYEIID